MGIYDTIRACTLQSIEERAMLTSELMGFIEQCDEDLEGHPTRAVYDLTDTSPDAVEWRAGRAEWKAQLNETLVWLAQACTNARYPLTIDLTEAPEAVRIDIAEALDNHPDLEGRSVYPPVTLESLSEGLNTWAKGQGLEAGCALEMLMANTDANGQELTDMQRRWLQDFVVRWDAVQAEVDARAAKAEAVRTAFDMAVERQGFDGILDLGETSDAELAAAYDAIIATKKEG